MAPIWFPSGAPSPARCPRPAVYSDQRPKGWSGHQHRQGGFMRSTKRFAAISALSIISAGGFLGTAGAVLGTAGSADAATFKFQDAAGNLDLLYGDKPVYRLMTFYNGNDSTK